jgi:hypothetical protein
MHDRNGTPLKKGDTVLIEAVIDQLHGGEDHCNVSLKTVHGRRPDGGTEYITSNTAVVVLHARAKEQE